jgi:hypothetical protein
VTGSYATTMHEREKQFTKAEVKRAQRAKKLQRVLGYPGLGTLAHSLNKSTWTNMDVTAADVRLAHDIYGPEVSARQGKARQPKNATAVITRVPVPLHMRGQQNLYVDLFFWREQAYLICVAKPLCLVITRDIPPQMMNTAGYERALTWTVNHIEQRGFSVGEILCDGDKLLRPLVDSFPNLIAAEAGAKVGDVEVEIRVLEEHMRSIVGACAA